MNEENAALNDLERYLSDPRFKDPNAGKENYNPNSFNIVAWWRGREAEFPVLTKMVFDVLAVPATSIPSKCIFSTSGRVLCDSRTSLSPNTVRMLMLSESWLKAIEKYHWKLRKRKTTTR